VLLAAPNDRYPNFDALMLGPSMGWLMLLAAIGLVTFFIAHRERWRRLWLGVCDPRSVATFRIVFGLFTLFNVNGLWELFTYLFTDEGLFPTDVAQQVRARGQFAGFGDGVTPGEPTGFYDAAAVWEWLKGPNYSLLMFDSSPGFFWAHMAAFEIAMAMLILGYQTRWVKWVALFLFHSTILRNTIYWEGTENVFRSFFFYLCLSRCGAAYSVDNWLRCRRLRRKGALSERGGPGDGAGVAADAERGASALEPIYRAIPAWPKWLMMIQTSIVYGYAGPTKNGGVWGAGDAFYYAFNLDHFYRFPPQALSSWFATTLFRVNTHVVHFWQMFFPLVVVGLVIRWTRRDGAPVLSGGDRRLARVGFWLFAAGIIGMIVRAMPVHYVPRAGMPSMTTVQVLIAVCAPMGLLVVRWIVVRLQTKPPKFTVLGREVVVDLDFALRWLLGRRLWLGLGAIFHVHLIVMMNIGWFNPGLLSSYIVFLNGPELASIGSRVVKSIARVIPGLRRFVTTPTPPEAPDLGHWPSDRIRLPLSAIWTSVGMLLIGALMHYRTLPPLVGRLAARAEKIARLEVPGAETLDVAHVGWSFVAAAAFLITITIRRRRGHAFDGRFAPAVLLITAIAGQLHHMDVLHHRWVVAAVLALTVIATRRPAGTSATVDDGVRVRWAYRPLGRVLIGGLVAYHLAGLTAWMLPDKDSMDAFRHVAKEPFSRWLRITHTTQSWKMFAPNPPRSNLFMRVLVHDKEGEVWDLNTDIYACFEEGADAATCQDTYPIPWVWYTRQRKINRRVVGAEGGNGIWYQKWHARWVCREWEADHDELPEKVELIKVTYRVPSPDEVFRDGAYDPGEQYRKTNRQKVVHTTYCNTAPYGRLSPAQREHRGLAPLEDPKKYRSWHKNRCHAWEKRLRREAEASGEVVEDGDPRFDFCEANG
jgi:uncharacterized membrane protein YphA (DoxX/SURF4 family)